MMRWLKAIYCRLTDHDWAWQRQRRSFSRIHSLVASCSGEAIARAGYEVMAGTCSRCGETTWRYAPEQNRIDGLDSTYPGIAEFSRQREWRG